MYVIIMQCTFYIKFLWYGVITKNQHKHENTSVVQCMGITYLGKKSLYQPFFFRFFSYTNYVSISAINI